MSALSNKEVVALIRRHFVPLAIDATNDYFWRGEEEQAFLKGNVDTFVVRTADGKTLGNIATTYATDYDQHLLKLLKKALAAFKPRQVGEIKEGLKGNPPQGIVVVNVVAKVMGKPEPYTLEKLFRFMPEAKKMSGAEQQSYLKLYNRTTQMFHSAWGRDHLWIRKDEAESLVKGILSESLKARIARYQLEDFTRGQAMYWHGKDDIRRAEMTLKDGLLTGLVHLEDKQGGREYVAELRGHVESKEGKLTRFDIVASGQYRGASGTTLPAAVPRGKFPVVVAFSLATGKAAADQVPPNAMLKIVGEAGYLGSR